MNKIRLKNDGHIGPVPGTVCPDEPLIVEHRYEEPASFFGISTPVHVQCELAEMSKRIKALEKEVNRIQECFGRLDETG